MKRLQLSFSAWEDLRKLFVCFFGFFNWVQKRLCNLSPLSWGSGSLRSSPALEQHKHKLRLDCCETATCEKALWIPPAGPSPLCLSSHKLVPGPPPCWSWLQHPSFTLDLPSMHPITALLASPGYHHWTCLLLLFRCRGTCQICDEGNALPALLWPLAPGSPSTAKESTLKLGAKHLALNLP